MIRLLTILFWFFMPVSTFLYAQEKATLPEFHNWFDEVVGLENTAIFNGIEYLEKHRMINEKHKFFQTSLFTPGTINYEGLTFYNVNMKYNIFEDLVIVRLPRKTGGEETFQLHPEKLQGFQINGSNFMNISSGKDPEVIGIHEIILDEGEFLLLKEHKRRIFLKRDGSYPYYEFNDPGAYYVVYINGEYKTIRNRREVLKVFPEYENIIKDYYKEHRNLQKADPDNFLTGLFEIIVSPINSKTQ